MNKKNHLSKRSPTIPSHLPQPNLQTALLPIAVPLTKIIPTQKILRLSQSELAAKVEESLNENPFLERVESLAGTTDHPSVLEKIPTSSFSGGEAYYSSRSSDLSSDKNILEEVNPERETSLTGDLIVQLEQLDWMGFSSQDRMIAEEIIALVGDRGYVDVGRAEEVMGDLGDRGVSREDFNRVWQLLKMNLEPSGVVCVDVEDSLAVQLLRQGYETSDLSVRIVRKFFPQLSKKQYAAIANALGVSSRDVKAAARVIQRLDPYPLRNKNQQGKEFDNSIITPDVMIRHREGRLEVMVNREMIPQIRMLKDVVEDMKKKFSTTEESKRYLKEKKEEAETLTQALQFRETNLKRVIDYLVERQEDFFVEGFSKLQPCRMGDVAKDLNIDLATLSRLVNSKYIATNWGVFLLRKMFSLPVRVNGKKVSPKVIEEKIRSLLHEFSDRKLSDRKIALMLKELGYPISRRTVNKYRNRLISEG